MINNSNNNSSSNNKVPVVDTRRIILVVGTAVVAATSIKTNTNHKEDMLNSPMVWDTMIISTNAVATVNPAWIITACSRVVATLHKTSHSRMMTTNTRVTRRAEAETMDLSNSSSTASNLAASRDSSSSSLLGFSRAETRMLIAMLVDGRTKPVAGVDPVGRAAKDF